MSNKFNHPTQFQIGKIEIDGEDVIGMFQNISIFENMYSPVITGSIQLLDSDKNDFISNHEIEGSEEISFEFTNADGDTLEFSGLLNGLRNKIIKNQRSMYIFDFTSEQVRKNEENFVVKRFRNSQPKDIISEMIEKLGGKEDKVEGEGLPLNFLGSRKRPTDIIKYALTHGVTQSAESSEKGTEQEEKSSGTTGFLCWQTLDGYRFNSIEKILKGEGGNDAGTFTHKMANHQLPMDEAMHAIVDYDFKQLGDIQSKMRFGAFKSVNISFDMDKGLYKEFLYEEDSIMTDKQKKAVTKPTRYLVKPFMNERFENSCTKADDNLWDQGRRYLQQNTAQQNTFADQTGNLTLNPRFKLRAGDKIEVKIPKVSSDENMGYNEKHTGNYIIKQVGHHMYADGRAYTRVQTLRSTTQQDDTSSQS